MRSSPMSPMAGCSQPCEESAAAYLGTPPEEGASARERARFWASLLPRLNRLRLEPAACEHLMAQLVDVVPPPTRSKLAAAGRSGAARAESTPHGRCSETPAGTFVAHRCTHRSPAEHARYPGSPTPRT